MKKTEKKIQKPAKNPLRIRTISTEDLAVARGGSLAKEESKKSPQT